MADLTLSIIIPAYSEEENLRLILPRLNKALAALNIKYEILVINTMKGLDNTATVCQENNARYLNRENSDFYGDAVRTGIKYASAPLILFMDADGSHSPEFVRDMFEQSNDADVVIASRYVRGGGSDNNKILIFMSFVVNKIFSWILQLDCQDVSNSFKLYRAVPLKRITLICNNFDIIEEILFKSKRENKHLKIKEIPYLFKERMFGHTKRNLFLFMVSYFFTLLRLRFIK